MHDLPTPPASAPTQPAPVVNVHDQPEAVARAVNEHFWELADGKPAPVVARENNED